MRITYVIEDFSMCGGVERVVSRKASILSSKYGHETTVISIYKDDRPVRYELDKGVRLVRLDVPMAKKSDNAIIMAYNRINTLIKAIMGLNKKIKETNSDIIFFTTTLGALSLPFCRTRAKKVYESHLARSFNPYNMFFTLMERRADMIVCLTEGDANEYRHDEKVKVIPNFISRPLSYVRDYSVKKAVAVGRLEYQKGFDILIDIWKDVAIKHPDWQLHIYGEGSLQEELQKQIDSSRLKEKVILYGSCTNMIERYASYSLHIMTSRYEGQGIVLIEAQSCGLPSVVFDYKYGARDIVKNGINGFLIEQDNKVSFTETLANIMDNTHLREEQGKKAQETAKKFFIENIIWRWEELIQNLSN